MIRRHLVRADEQEFLDGIRALAGDRELDGAGTRRGNAGLWINNLRSEPRRAWKSLREAQAVKKEGVIQAKKGWGCYLMDLWKKERV